MVAKPAGVRTVITGIPSHTGHDASTPRRYFRLGGFTLGNVDGFAPAYPFEYAQQLLYPIPAVWELLAYDIRDGASCTFYELVETASVSTLAPWDRAPVAWTQSAFVQINGPTSQTTAWTTTPVAGRKLMVASFELRLIRAVAATTVSNVQLRGLVGGTQILNAIGINNTIGDIRTASLNAGPLYLPAGTTISATYEGSDTGGTYYAYLLASGLLFDA